MFNQSKLMTALDLVATISMITASITIVWYVTSAKAVISSPPEIIQDAQGSVPAPIVRMSGAKGNDTARVAMLEFSDYQCPFCARYTTDVQQTIKREFVDAGVIKYVFMNFPLESIHPHAFKAAEAAECSKRQGKFWEMHDRLFANRTSIAEPGIFMKYAGDLGLKPNEFAECLSGVEASTVKQHIALGKDLGITSTPAFLIGNVEADGSIRLRKKLMGAHPFAEFKKMIEEML